MPQDSPAALAFAAHDHGRCRLDALAALETHCAARKLRLTPVRRRVMELLAAAHRALGAYDLLETLATEGLGSQPPVVYRALEFLMAQGFVHKIERLNAYVGCAHPGHAGHAAFLICIDCGQVGELDDPVLADSLARTVAAQGFAMERSVLEITGTCPGCGAGQ